jgi:hypothetical protein
LRYRDSYRLRYRDGDRDRFWNRDRVRARDRDGMGYCNRDGPIHGDRIRFRDFNLNRLRDGDWVGTRDGNGVRGRHWHRDVSVDSDWNGLRHRDRDLLRYSCHAYWRDSSGKPNAAGAESDSSRS